MSDDLPREDVVAVVDRLVEDLLTGAGVEGPPVDAIALAQRHLGMIVCLDRRQRQRGRAQRAAGRPQIFLRPEPSEERHQWTVAHEIGEHFKAALLQRLGLEPERTGAMSGESLANLFAHRLLVPTRWYAADAPAHGYDILELKKRYSTSSHEVLALRLIDLPEPCIITIIDNDHIHRRRSNAWRVRKKLEPAEQQCQQKVSRTGLPQVVRAGGWTVQGWPVHQEDWKREVLRSVVEAFE
jgi:Zn-dependent peptidase ImmA (M78 family)